MWHSEIRRGDNSARTVLRRTLGLPPRPAASLQTEAFKGLEGLMAFLVAFTRTFIETFKGQI